MKRQLFLFLILVLLPVFVFAQPLDRRAKYDISKEPIATCSNMKFMYFSRWPMILRKTGLLF